MDEKTISAKLRTELKKSGAKKIRKSGRIPAVIYGHNEPLSVSVDAKEFETKFEKLSESTIIQLKMGNKSYDVLVKNYQEDILTNRIKHIDFFEIEKGKTLRTNVTVHIEGNAKGVKEGGILEQRLHELEIECLPKDIPEYISVDVSELETGEAIHVSDVAVPEGVKVLNMLEQTVVSVTLVKEEVVETTEEDELLEEGEAAEAAEEETEAED